SKRHKSLVLAAKTAKKLPATSFLGHFFIIFCIFATRQRNEGKKGGRKGRRERRKGGNEGREKSLLLVASLEMDPGKRLFQWFRTVLIVLSASRATGRG
ncbi:MAG: hypothetical protein FWG03_04960, partial [Clostridiales bacterium]|nr:hypothetical protein [Clostridiales bacterium]